LSSPRAPSAAAALHEPEATMGVRFMAPTTMVTLVRARNATMARSSD
jgi:hypothetical protein